MFGLDVLSDPNNQFGITAVEFINGSFAHWQRNRYNGDRFFPTIDKIISGSNSSSSSGSYLPVCSNDMVLHDLSKSMKLAWWWGRERYLPCVYDDTLGTRRYPG